MELSWYNCSTRSVLSRSLLILSRTASLISQHFETSRCEMGRVIHSSPVVRKVHRHVVASRPRCAIILLLPSVEYTFGVFTPQTSDTKRGDLSLLELRAAGCRSTVRLRTGLSGSEPASPLNQLRRSGQSVFANVLCIHRRTTSCKPDVAQ